MMFPHNVSYFEFRCSAVSKLILMERMNFFGTNHFAEFFSVAGAKEFPGGKLAYQQLR